MPSLLQPRGAHLKYFEADLLDVVSSKFSVLKDFCLFFGGNENKGICF